MSRLLDLENFVAEKLAWHQRIASDPTVSLSAKAVAGFILHDLNASEGGAWRGQESMAAGLGVSARQLRRLLDELEAASYLQVEVRKGRGRTNMCRATLPAERAVASENRTSTAAQTVEKRTSATVQMPKNRTLASRKADSFDVAFVALGYETRCQWVWSESSLAAKVKIATQFGFLTKGKYSDNLNYFKSEGFTNVLGVGDQAVAGIVDILRQFGSQPEVSVFIDISSMSREMIANVILAVNNAFCSSAVRITAAYAPSKFVEAAEAAPIRVARPITRVLSGWSAMPEKPLGAIFGLGCENGLALGAMQVLEPDNAWLFTPVGLDDRFSASLRDANEHIEDIFDVTRFAYDIRSPTTLRAKYESLLNSIGDEFRLITVPFGPKLFAWSVLSTLIFSGRDDVGVWTFSSAEKGHAADREAEGPIIWHSLGISPRKLCPV